MLPLDTEASARMRQKHRIASFARIDGGRCEHLHHTRANPWLTQLVSHARSLRGDATRPRASSSSRTPRG